MQSKLYWDIQHSYAAMLNSISTLKFEYRPQAQIFRNYPKRNIARNKRTRSYVSVYLQYIFRLCICRKCMDAIERLVFTAATAIIVVAASDTRIEKEISG